MESANMRLGEESRVVAMVGWAEAAGCALHVGHPEQGPLAWTEGWIKSDKAGDADKSSAYSKAGIA